MSRKRLRCATSGQWLQHICSADGIPSTSLKQLISMPLKWRVNKGVPLLECHPSSPSAQFSAECMMQSQTLKHCLHYQTNQPNKQPTNQPNNCQTNKRNKQTNKNKTKQTNRQTDRQTDKQTKNKKLTCHKQTKHTHTCTHARMKAGTLTRTHRERERERDTHTGRQARTHEGGHTDTHTQRETHTNKNTHAHTRIFHTNQHSRPTNKSTHFQNHQQTKAGLGRLPASQSHAGLFLASFQRYVRGTVRIAHVFQNSPASLIDI